MDDLVNVVPEDNLSYRLELNLPPNANAFCLADDEHEQCIDKYHLQHRMQYIQELILTGLVYISKLAIQSFFPGIINYKIKRALFKELTIPYMSGSGSTIALLENENLEKINVDPEMAALSRFTVSSGEQVLKQFELGEIKGYSIRLDFKVYVNADRVRIAFPKNRPEYSIDIAEIGYYGNHPDNVKLTFANTQGKIKSLKYKFTKKPNSMKHLWPPIRTIGDTLDIEMYTPITRNADDGTFPRNSRPRYQLQKWTWYDSLAAANKILVEETGDMASARQFSNTLPFKDPPATDETDETPASPVETGDSNVITLDFIIADISSIMSSTADNTKTYTVNTYFLVIDGAFSDASINLVTDVTINFQVLVTADYPKLFGFRMQAEYGWKTITFTHIDGMIERWGPFSIETIYAMIGALIDVIKPNFMTESESFAKVRSAIANKLFDEINIVNTRHMFTEDALSDSSYHYLHSAMKKVTDLRLFFNTYGTKTRRLPRLAPSLYKEKTLIYQEIAKSLIASEHVSILTNGQKILLDITAMKSGTQKNIATEQLNRLEGQERNAKNTLKALKDKRIEYQAEYQENIQKFEEAVARREREAILDVVLSVFNGVMGLFSGGLGAITAADDVSKSVIRLLATIKNLKRMMNRIKTFIETIATFMGFAGSVMDIYNNVNYVQEGYDPGFDATNIDTVVEKISGLNAADILEWDIAARQVEGMMDASLSAEIPETLAYKTAILKMVTAGKAETEASIEYAELMGDIYMTKYRMKAYEDEITYINNARKNLLNQDLFQRNLKRNSMQLKLDLYLHLIDYCDSSFYYNLQPCLAYREFSFGASLSQIMLISNKILAESVENMNDLFPPPQSFFDKSIEMTTEETCDETVKQFKATLTTCNGDLESQTCRTAVLNKMKLLNAVDEEDDEDQFYAAVDDKTFTQDEKDTIKFKRKYFNCLSSNVYELKTNHETSISISLDNEEFRRFDRVRIEDVKVILHGATTTEEYIEVVVENQGVVEDRLNDQTFVFTGDKWKRIIRYKGEGIDTKYEIKGNVHGEFANKFYSPTPFSTWLISVSSKPDSGLNLAGLTSIELMFSGSLMINDQITTTSEVEETPATPPTEESKDLFDNFTVEDPLETPSTTKSKSKAKS